MTIDEANTALAVAANAKDRLAACKALAAAALAEAERLETSSVRPATFTMHCPNGPTHACAEHARQIEVLFIRMFGIRVRATTAPAGAQCDNCINETKAAR